MGLRAKFNVVTMAVFVAGLALTGILSWQLLHRSARQEVVQNAGIMMGAAHSMREYTITQIRPLIDLEAAPEFVPQTVPAFAATEAFNALRVAYPDYSYKEATLNPTNLRDRATDWEADVVHEFRNDDSLSELVGERESSGGRALWLARPIKITNPECLTCHSTVDAAPESLVAMYGDSNGFGWEMDEIVGAQIVTVPMSLALEKAQHSFWLVMASLVTVFAILFTAVNVMLGTIVIRPIARISDVADRVSLGEMEIEEFDESGSDEVATLKASFNRMHRSLERAMKMIQG